MRKAILILIVAAFIAIPGIAEKELKTSKTYNTGDVLSINGSDYTVQVGRGEVDSVGLLLEGNYTMIHVSDCLDFGKDQLCLHARVSNTSAVFNVYDMSAELEYGIDANETDFIAGEERQFWVSINSTGGSTAEQVRFRQDFNDGMSISDVYGCVRDGNSISWSGYLKVDNTKNCKYNIVLNEPGTMSITTELTYVNFGENKSVDIDDLELLAYIPFNYSLHLHPDNVSIGQNATIELNITANITGTNISFQTIKVLENDYLKIREDRLSNLFEDEILRSRRAIFNKTLQIKADSEFMRGTDEIRLLMTYSKEDGMQDYRHTAVFPVNVSGEGLKITAEQDKDLVPSAEGIIRLRSENPDEHMSYTKVMIDASSDIPGFPEEFKRLDIGTLDIPFTAPDEPGEYHVEFRFSYYDKYKRLHETNMTVPIDVFEPGEIKVKKSIEYEDSNGTRTAYMRISLMNDLGVDVQDLTVHEEGPFTGNDSVTISLNESETREVMEIPIEPGDVESLGTVETVTVVMYTLGSRDLEKRSPMAVDASQIKAELAPIEPDTNDQENLTGSNETGKDPEDESFLEQNPTIDTVPFYLKPGNIFGAASVLVLIVTMGWLRQRHKKHQQDPKHYHETRIEERSEKMLSELKHKITEEKGRIEGRLGEMRADHVHRQDLSLHDQLSILDDEITGLLNKVERTPELLKEASLKEQEFLKIKAQIDRLKA